MNAAQTIAAVLARAPRSGTLVNGKVLYREDDLLAAATQIDNPPAPRRTAPKETDHA